MDFHEQLQSDLIKSLREKDDTRKWVIKMLKSAIQLAEVSKGSGLTQEEFLSVVQKEIKTRNESLADATKANRPDLIEAAENEITILKTYLPAQLSEEELLSMVREAIQDAGASAPKDMGAVMKLLLPRLQGRAPNSEASRLVKAELTEE
ncbi:MAG: GatB/YqeY domain-containing protein [Anaerolineaceae bacterium]|jgi:uncharacterized protein YqeY|nr:GatB/YqeY domain-containing protein [Anaerolineaceae bacterium]